MTILTKDLTDPHDPVQSAQLMVTYPGMAHLAGTGPEDKTCRECAMWGMPSAFVEGGPPSPYRYRPFVRAGALAPNGGELCGRRCQKYHRLILAGLHVVRGRAVPHHAAACRHFIQNANPPAAKRDPPLRKKKKPANENSAPV
jgi:hypothetical protein